MAEDSGGGMWKWGMHADFTQQKTCIYCGLVEIIKALASTCFCTIVRFAIHMILMSIETGIFAIKKFGAFVN